jgi:hypothetical protein
MENLNDTDKPLDNAEKELRISDVIHRISWVYFVGERHLYKRDENPKMFLDEELSKKYWEEIGKDKYTWWRGVIYGV